MSEPQPGAGAMVKHAGQLSRITTPDEFRAYLDVKAKERWHLLSPATDFGSLPQQWALVPTVVTLNPEPAAKDVYKDPLFCKGEDVALSAVALRKIASAGGSIIRTVRLDDGRIPYLWAYKAIIRYRSFVDALWKEAEGESTYDLRDGSPRIQKMINAAKRNNRDATGQIEGARMHGQAGCESRAINRAIRGAFALKQTYTTAELAKPFVAFNLVFQPDMSDPQQKAAVLANALGGVDALYPGAPTSAPALPAAAPVSHASDDAIDGETVSQTVTAGPAQPASQATSLDDDDEPTFHVTGAFEQNGRFWITTQETADTPLYVETADVAKALNRTRKAAQVVSLETEKRNGETWIVQSHVVAAAEKY